MTRDPRILAAAIVSLAIYLPPRAHSGGPGSGRRCNPDGICTVCKDCSSCKWCVSGKGSCSVCQNQSGPQQRARDAKKR